MPQGRPPASAENSRNHREAPQVRRRLLIEAATRCLEKGGIQAFTIDAICREAGVSRGLINYYFSGKNDLLVAVYRSVLFETRTQTIAHLDSMPPEAPALERLRALVDACFLPDTFGRYDFLVWLALWGEIATNPRLRAVHREHFEMYRQKLAAEIEKIAKARNLAVEARRLANSFMALLDGLWLEWCQDEEVMRPEDAQEACWDLLESKLGPLR